MAILVSNMQANSVLGVEDGERLSAGKTGGLERSCAPQNDRIELATPWRGIERIAAHFHGNGFSPHRHDTYAIGITLSGVQTFRYRGSARFSLPGKVIVLHPDEVHDGAAGTDDGLIYRMLYLPPDLISEAAGDTRRPLPFVADPVVSDPQLRHALAELLEDLTQEPPDLLLDDALSGIVAGLQRHSSSWAKPLGTVAHRAVLRSKDYLDAHAPDAISSADLEEVAGLDRYELSRQFRRMLGTSPHRYLVMRRLDRARLALRAGAGLADAALAAGFSDQPHFGRHFKKTYGMSPGRWLALVKGS